jgi:hypothetical protein
VLQKRCDPNPDKKRVLHKVHPIYATLFKLALAGIERAGSDFEKRLRAFEELNETAKKVLDDPLGAPGVQAFTPVTDGPAWSNLYVVKSTSGWHLVYWYGEVPDGKGSTPAFLALLLFDSRGEPLKSVLDQARAMSGAAPDLPTGIADVLKELLQPNDPIAIWLESLSRAQK